jgi:RNase adaptor protein for sRNA GlmZ degradation
MTIVKQEHRVEVENGKYTFVVPSNDHRVHILRHGEPWYTPENGQPSHALHAIMCELDAARVVIQAARELVRNRSTLDPVERLVEALTKHAALTNDCTPPNLWTGSAPSPSHEQPEAEKIASHVDQLMRINAQMFDDTIRVLGEQSKTLLEQVMQLTANNANLRRELEEASSNRRDREFAISEIDKAHARSTSRGSMVVRALASQKSVREYLDALVWDQKPRIDRWLIDYAGAADTEYVRAVSRGVLIAAVRRVRQPGCRCGEMLILESPQGTGKTSALRILAVEDAWFADNLPLDARGILEMTAGKWIVEASELTLLSQEDVKALKACLSRQHDEARLAYQTTVSRVPRQFLIVGTTDVADDRRFCETEGYLRDAASNRRFLSVRVQRFDLERLRGDRDQLWAEASVAEASF